MDEQELQSKIEQAKADSLLILYHPTNELLDLFEYDHTDRVIEIGHNRDEAFVLSYAVVPDRIDFIKPVGMQLKLSYNHYQNNA